MPGSSILLKGKTGKPEGCHGPGKERRGTEELEKRKRQERKAIISWPLCGGKGSGWFASPRRPFQGSKSREREEERHHHPSSKRVPGLGELGERREEGRSVYFVLHWGNRVPEHTTAIGLRVSPQKGARNEDSPTCRLERNEGFCDYTGEKKAWKGGGVQVRKKNTMPVVASTKKDSRATRKKHVERSRSGRRKGKKKKRPGDVSAPWNIWVATEKEEGAGPAAASIPVGEERGVGGELT